jgi:predicted N-acetyltransferase YhbS
MRSRPLTERDLDAVVALDAALSGRTRKAYFERRLDAARTDPGRHLQLAAEEDGRLAGFMLGRALEGEFGRSEPAVRLEAFGIAPAAQRHGLGLQLSAAFEAQASRRGLCELRTTGLWREHALLHFLDRAGYRLAPSHVLDRATVPDLDPEARDAFEVALLDEADIEGVARIDRRHTGRDRRGYLCRALREALADSAVRISLAARADGGIAGYLMARVDYGDFGRSEPAAVIDTLGVDPLRLHQGVGRALASQLFMNLAALGVERVETVVASGQVDLMAFFHAAGFAPSERLAFEKRLQ